MHRKERTGAEAQSVPSVMYLPFHVLCVCVCVFVPTLMCDAERACGPIVRKEVQMQR